MSGTTYELKIIVSGQDQGGTNVLQNINAGLEKTAALKSVLDAVIGTVQGLGNSIQGLSSSNDVIEQQTSNLQKLSATLSDGKIAAASTQLGQSAQQSKAAIDAVTGSVSTLTNQQNSLTQSYVKMSAQELQSLGLNGQQIDKLQVMQARYATLSSSIVAYSASIEKAEAAGKTDAVVLDQRKTKLNEMQVRLGALGNEITRYATTSTQATQTTKQFDTALDQTKQSASGSVGALQNVTENLIKLGLAGLGINAITDILGKLKDGVMALTQPSKELENYRVQFTTLFGGSTQDADAFVTKIKAIADVTPQTTQQIAQMAQVMLAMGGTALASTDNIRLFVDVMAGSRQPADEVTRWLSRIYSDLQNGRPFGEAAQNLQDMGLMSAQTRKHLEDMQNAGKSGNEIWQAYADTLQQRFGGGAERASHTMEGLESTASDAIDNIKAKVGQPIFDVMEVGLDKLLEKMKSPEFSAFLDGVAKGLHDIMTVYAALLGIDLDGMIRQQKTLQQGTSDQTDATKQQVDALQQQSKSLKDVIDDEEHHVTVMQHSLDLLKEQDRMNKEARDLQIQKLRDQVADTELAAKQKLLPIEQELYHIDQQKKDLQQQLKDLTDQQKATNEAAKASEEAMLDALRQQLDVTKEQHQAERDRLDDAKRGLQDQLDAVQRATRDQLLPIEQSLYAISIQRKDAEEQLSDIVARQKAHMDDINRAQNEQLDALQAQYDAVKRSEDTEKERLDIAKETLQAQLDTTKQQLQAQLLPIEQQLTDVARERKDVEQELHDVIDRQKQALDAMDTQEQQRLQDIQAQNDARREQNNLILDGIRAQMGELNAQISERTKPIEEQISEITRQRNEANLEYLQATNDTERAMAKEKLDNYNHQLEVLRAQKQVIEDQYADQQASLDEQQKAAEEKAKADEAAAQKQLDDEKKAYEQQRQQQEDLNKAEQAQIQARLDALKQQADSLEEQKQQIEDANKQQQAAIQEQIKLLEQRGKEEQRQYDAQAQSIKDQIDAKKKAFEEENRRQEDADTREQQAIKSKIDGFKAQEESLDRQKHDIEESSKQQEQALRDQLDALTKQGEEKDRQNKAEEQAMQKLIDAQKKANDDADKTREAMQKQEQDALQAKIRSLDTQQGQLEQQKKTIEDETKRAEDSLNNQITMLERIGREKDSQAQAAERAREKEIKDLQYQIQLQKDSLDENKKKIDELGPKYDENVVKPIAAGKQGLDDSTDSAGKFRDKVLDAMNPFKGISDFITDTIKPKVDTTFSGLQKWFSVTLPDSAGDFKRSIEENLGAVGRNFDSAGPFIQSKLDELGHNFANFIRIDEMQRNLDHMKDEIGNWITSHVDDIKSRAVGFGTGLIDGFKQGLREKAASIGDFLYNAIRSMYDNFPMPFGIPKPPFPPAPDWGRLIPGFAQGTSSAPAGVYEVAEDRAELVVGRRAMRFQGGERVFNGGDTQRILQQRGGDEYHLHIHTSNPADVEPIMANFSMMKSLVGAKT